MMQMSALDSHDKAHMTDFDGEQMEGNASEGLKGWSGASPKFHVQSKPSLPSSPYIS